MELRIKLQEKLELDDRLNHYKWIYNQGISGACTIDRPIPQGVSTSITSFLEDHNGVYTKYAKNATYILVIVHDVNDKSKIYRAWKELYTKGRRRQLLKGSKLTLAEKNRRKCTRIQNTCERMMYDYKSGLITLEKLDNYYRKNKEYLL